MTFDASPSAPAEPLTSAERTRQRRQRAHDAGMCRSCCKRRPPPGQSNCEVCCQGTEDRDRIHREAAWNVCCQRCGTHRFDCKASAKRERPVRRRTR